MKHLYFVRHGESEDNLRQLWSTAQTPLTDLGRRQALQAAMLIKNKGVICNLITCSTLPRAVETATIIAKTIGYDKNVSQNALFIERNWGTLTGMSKTDPELALKNIERIDDIAGAEKLADLHKRAIRALEFLKSQNHDTVILVGHSSFGRALRRVVNGEPYTNEYLPDLVVYDNGEITKLI
jgi:broad specificity phosphatase PhoE